MANASYVSAASPPPFAGQFAEVEVDTETGQVTVTKLVMAVDAGVPINPLTAIHDCHNGALASPEFAFDITAVIDELLVVAAAEGISLERAALLERVYKVISLTAGNYSSMVQDLRHGATDPVGNSGVKIAPHFAADIVGFETSQGGHNLLDNKRNSGRVSWRRPLWQPTRSA